ncbi:hypothetical protein O7609_03080 [Streptomyces sp. WMMC1477]|nr:hypothetical protein [Streptomyces sp. WMMC1477]MCZ7430675.1 hypothetical protein [Streptomyces sp. WMMC1477]
MALMRWSSRRLSALMDSASARMSSVRTAVVLAGPAARTGVGVPSVWSGRAGGGAVEGGAGEGEFADGGDLEAVDVLGECGQDGGVGVGLDGVVDGGPVGQGAAQVAGAGGRGVRVVEVAGQGRVLVGEFREPGADALGERGEGVGGAVLG